MRSFLVILFCCTCLCGYSQLIEVRKSFHRAVLDEDQSQEFHDFLDTIPLTSAALTAYKAASEAMLARVYWNPFSKFSQVLKYEDLMDIAIDQDPTSLEIRFLRISIEYNLPRFLGMSRHLNEDRDVIVSNISSIPSMDLDPAFARFIIYFLNDTGLCNQEEILAMEQGLKSVE